MFFFHIRVGRICYGAYHWRCLKPQRVSRYGQNENYVCANCSEGGTTTTLNSSHRSSNGLNQTESFETHERDYDDGMTRKTSEDIHRPYEENPINQRTDFDDYSPSKTNGIHYQHQNSKINEKQLRRLIDLISLEKKNFAYLQEEKGQKRYQYRFLRHKIDVYARI